MQLDDLDMKLLQLLQEDARLSYRQLAERTGSSTPTVSARVRALQDVGVIRGFRADVDAQVLGGSLYAIAVRVKPSGADAVARAVVDAPGVEEVVLIAGGCIHVRARFMPSGNTLERFSGTVSELESVLDFQVHPILRVARSPHPLPIPQQADVPCHFCRGPIHKQPVRFTLDERTHVFCCRHCLASFRERHEQLEAKK